MAPLRIDAGELTVDELLAVLNEGQRVIVRTTLAGIPHDVVIRFDGETYYCDTPTRLHRHSNEAEMRTCIERNGYGRDATKE
jgi:hypothetical protein